MMAFTLFYLHRGTADGKAHIRDGVDLKRTMNTVITALIPTSFGMWNVGYHHFNAIGIGATFFEQFLFGAIKVIPMVVVLCCWTWNRVFVLCYQRSSDRRGLFSKWYVNTLDYAS